MPAKFDAPIPGQSLTMEPGNAPWEQPPLYPQVEQALAFHLKALSNPDAMEDAMFLLSQKFPLNALVESMTTYAVMNGYHTVDVSQLINPVIHEYLKTMAEAGGITNLVEDDGPTQEEKAKLKFKKQLMVLLQEEMPNNPDDTENNIAPSVGMEALPATPPSDEEQIAKLEEDKPKGFIGRRK